MKIIQKNNEKEVNVLALSQYFEKFYTKYKNTHGALTAGNYLGISMDKLFEINGLKESNYNVFAKDGYKVTYESSLVKGIPYIAVKKDENETKPTYIIKDNDDGRFRVVDVASVEILDDKTENIESIEVKFNDLAFKNILIGKREYMGIGIKELLDQYNIKGEIIDFLSDDNYHLTLEREKYLTDAFLLKKDRKVAGLSLKLGNWIKFIKRIKGDNKEIIIK